MSRRSARSAHRKHRDGSLPVLILRVGPMVLEVRQPDGDRVVDHVHDLDLHGVDQCRDDRARLDAADNQRLHERGEGYGKCYWSEHRHGDGDGVTHP